MIALILKKRLGRAERIAVVGIGNELRGDDAAGVLVAQELDRSLSRAARTKLVPIHGGSAPENATGEIIRLKPSHVVLVDAAELGARAGTVRLIDPADAGSTVFSTHTLPLSLIVSYLKQSIDCEALILGIQPATTEFGAPISSEVKRSVALISGMLRDLI